MASNSTASSQPVVLSATDRLERLVNNKQFADVAFRVGKSRELMFGHKAILAEASEVFRSQFAELLRESRKNIVKYAIPIVDIEPGVFKELLRYIYTDKANVTAENALDIFYGLSKYRLIGLKKACEAFLMGNLPERVALQLFDRNRRYELEAVNRACLDIICDNPIKAFVDECFLKLSSKSVELIASQRLINCQTTQLLMAIEKWVKANEDEPVEGARILSMVREQNNRGLKCKKMYNFSAGHYLNSTVTITASGFQCVVAQQNPTLQPRFPVQLQLAQINAAGCQPVIAQRSPILGPRLPVRQAIPRLPQYATAIPRLPVQQIRSTVQIPPAYFVLHINSDFPFSIYGIGICIKASRVLNPLTLDITVKRTKNGGGHTGQPITTKRTVTPNDKFCVEEILFEKLTFDVDSKCIITVYADHGREQLFCYKSFEPEKQIVGLRFTSHYARSSNLLPHATNSILSYVLYDSPDINLN